MMILTYLGAIDLSQLSGRHFQPENQLLDSPEAQIELPRSWAGCSPPSGSKTVRLGPLIIGPMFVVVALTGSADVR